MFQPAGTGPSLQGRRGGRYVTVGGCTCYVCMANAQQNGQLCHTRRAKRTISGVHKWDVPPLELQTKSMRIDLRRTFLLFTQALANSNYSSHYSFLKNKNKKQHHNLPVKCSQRNNARQISCSWRAIASRSPPTMMIDLSGASHLAA